MLIKLIAPEGATSAFANGEEYLVADGQLLVPEEAASPLVESHGYSFAPVQDQAQPEADLEPAPKKGRAKADPEPAEPTDPTE